MTAINPFPPTATESIIYAPPNHLSFRLINKSSRNALVSRLNQQPEVWHQPSGEPSIEQYFSLIHGSGSKAGKCVIKSNATGQVLFSRRGQQPFVGHAPGDGQYQDNWHEFRPGTGFQEGWFRIITPSHNVALISRNDVDPQISNRRAEDVHEDQYWKFEPEPLEVVDVEWNLESATVAKTHTTCAADVFVENTKDVPQRFVWTFAEEIEWSGCGTRSDGFPLGAGVTITSGLPTLSSGKPVVEDTVVRWRLGSPIVITIGCQATHSFDIPPASTLHAFAMTAHAEIDVPFVLRVKGKLSGSETTTNGVWHGMVAGHYTPCEIIKRHSL